MAAARGNPAIGFRRLKDTIKRNVRRIKELEEKLKDHDKNCQPIINNLQEEIRRLKEENQNLDEKIKNNRETIGDLKQSYTFLEEDIEIIKQEKEKLKEKLESTEKQLEEHGQKLKNFELHSEDELVIRELCSKVQHNILRIVLGKSFNKIDNKIVEHLENYISSQIEDVNEQKEARSRWKKLQEMTKWNNFLIQQLQEEKNRGNKTAHPPLTEEKIDVAKDNLKEKGELGPHKVKAVDQLKNIWKQTNYNLLQTTGTSSEKKLDQGGPRNLPATGQDQGTYASKAAKTPRVLYSSCTKLSSY